MENETQHKVRNNELMGLLHQHGQVQQQKKLERDERRQNRSQNTTRYPRDTEWPAPDPLCSFHQLPRASLGTKRIRKRPSEGLGNHGGKLMPCKLAGRR